MHRADRHTPVHLGRPVRGTWGARWGSAGVEERRAGGFCGHAGVRGDAVRAQEAGVPGYGNGEFDGVPSGEDGRGCGGTGEPRRGSAGGGEGGCRGCAGFEALEGSSRGGKAAAGQGGAGVAGGEGPVPAQGTVGIAVFEDAYGKAGFVCCR